MNTRLCTFGGLCSVKSTVNLMMDECLACGGDDLLCVPTLH